MAHGVLTVAWHLARMGLATAFGSIHFVRSIVLPQITFFHPLSTFLRKLLFGGRKERQLLLIQATRLEKNRRAEMTRLLVFCRFDSRAWRHVAASFVESDPESAPETGTIHGRPQGSSCLAGAHYLLCCMSLHFILARTSRRTSQKPAMSARPFFQLNVHGPRALELFSFSFCRHQSMSIPTCCLCETVPNMKKAQYRFK